MIVFTVDRNIPMLRSNLEKYLPGAVRAVESAVLNSCEPFVPYRTGQLCRSGHTSGVGLQGSVTWSAPHAAECYYASRSFGKKHHPHATSRWFEAAKAKDMEQWRMAAADVLTGRTAERSVRNG